MKLLSLFSMMGVALAAPAVLPKTVPVVVPTGDLVPNSYIAVFKKDVDVSFVRGYAAALGARSYAIGDNFKALSGTFSEEVLERLMAETDLFEYIEQDQMMYALATQTNPPSWGQDRIDQRSLPLDSRMNYYDNAGAGVDAYIVDTGIMTTHNDFGGRAVFGFKANANWGNSDGNGHGTHVASTTAGTTYGLAKKAGLVAVKVLSDLGSGTNTGVIAGVEYVATEGVRNKDVANMSLGGGASAALDDAVEAAVAAGIFFAVAAGNDNANACNYSPARAPTAFTVMATTSTDARATYSNFGNCADGFAPGSSITAAWIDSNSDTNTISGTSMASPHVCGCAALQQGQTARTPAALTTFLESQATEGEISNPGTGSPNLMLYCPF